ncbi:RNA polymerase sigma factor [Allokutzneria sp. A3M-2-11 16]|uniref:RNA polymerase sigma factor n=1 Tax=Allokutzneria sp. A3M-2-11 16 TaxID=2962043 RepID=UPI0020B8854C|nr:RNA polymerase sigma factor [Allokutzneria sp. A3M-2-11 16]MCP3801215.1 RNA polymerase sigma factor [Allokutzneria sp. A3M-2-11 16]
MTTATRLLAVTERSVLVTEPPGDRELWLRSANGDRDAFGELFERHAEAVWNHAYRLTGSWATAEDLASSTFLTAWRKCGELVLVSESALPWLFTVAGNLARTESRRLRRFRRAVDRLPEPAAVRDHADGVAQRVDDDRRLREVLAAVARLPRGEREAVQLCLLGELSFADAATALGIAESSVRARIFRARAKLRAVLPEGASR